MKYKDNDVLNFLQKQTTTLTFIETLPIAPTLSKNYPTESSAITNLLNQHFKLPTTINTGNTIVINSNPVLINTVTQGNNANILRDLGYTDKSIATCNRKDYSSLLAADYSHASNPNAATQSASTSTSLSALNSTVNLKKPKKSRRWWQRWSRIK